MAAITKPDHGCEAIALFCELRANELSEIIAIEKWNGSGSLRAWREQLEHQLRATGWLANYIKEQFGEPTPPIPATLQARGYNGNGSEVSNGN